MPRATTDPGLACAEALLKRLEVSLGVGLARALVALEHLVASALHHVVICGSKHLVAARFLDGSRAHIGVLFDKRLLERGHALLPDLCHLRPEVEDDILEPKDAESASLVVEGDLGGLVCNLLERFEVLAHI